VPAFAKVPLWLTHAIDDPVVPYAGSVDIAAALEAAGARVTRGTWAGDNSAGRAQDQAAEAAARRLLAQARHSRSHTLFTTYTAGTVAVNAHFSWGPMYETDVMLDWLFAQERTRR
jgi:predicted peptidase